MQVPFLGRAPRTKETLPDFLKWSRVTRHPLVFRELTGSQRTPGVWGVTFSPIDETMIDLVPDLSAFPPRRPPRSTYKPSRSAISSLGSFSFIIFI